MLAAGEAAEQLVLLRRRDTLFLPLITRTVCVSLCAPSFLFLGRARFVVVSYPASLASRYPKAHKQTQSKIPDLFGASTDDHPKTMADAAPNPKVQLETTVVRRAVSSFPLFVCVHV